jgi:hypothetical protein
MDFKEYLLSRDDGDDPRGDLIRDVRRDPMFPKECNRLGAYVEYLHSKRACREAVEELRRAWKAYKSFERRHQDA